MDDPVLSILDLLDAQRETAYAALEGLTPAQIWQRPAQREWCIGEILDHNYLLIASTLPLVRQTWKAQWRRAEKKKDRPYETEIADPYRKAKFPQWVGFLWTPRYHPKKPAALELLMKENLELHQAVRAFYAGKNPAVLGNIYIYDPLIGRFNLIVTLRIGVYHDQLHFDDVIRMAKELKAGK